MNNKTIGILGYGNMGSAIAQRLKSEYKIWAFDKDKSKTENLSGIKLANSAADLVNKVDTLILAVKPQDFHTVLNEIKNYVNYKLIISIAAGITTKYIQKYLGDVRVIRVMPNLPAKIGKGMICLCKGKFATNDDLYFTRELFDSLGEIMLIEENQMNAVTAMSGSGPGFFYYLIKDKPKEEWKVYAREKFIPKFSQDAQNKGFTPEQARLLAEVTANGSIALLEQTGLSPGVLCIQVTSKGGTTEAGLKVLQDIDFLPQATGSALIVAEKLSKDS